MSFGLLPQELYIPVHGINLKLFALDILCHFIVFLSQSKQIFGGVAFLIDASGRFYFRKEGSIIHVFFGIVKWLVFGEMRKCSCSSTGLTSFYFSRSAKIIDPCEEVAGGSHEPLVVLLAATPWNLEHRKLEYRKIIYCFSENTEQK